MDIVSQRGQVEDVMDREGVGRGILLFGEQRVSPRRGERSKR